MDDPGLCKRSDGPSSAIRAATEAASDIYKCAPYTAAAMDRSARHPPLHPLDRLLGPIDQALRTLLGGHVGRPALPGRTADRRNRRPAGRTPARRRPDAGESRRRSRRPGALSRPGRRGRAAQRPGLHCSRRPRGNRPPRLVRDRLQELGGRDQPAQSAVVRRLVRHRRARRPRRRPRQPGLRGRNRTPGGRASRRSSPSAAGRQIRAAARSSSR